MKRIKMEKCNFCSNMFGDTKMLKQHQKKTKYCLKIQESKAKEEIEYKQRKEADEIILKEKANQLTCQFCGKQFTTKYLLNIHQTQTKFQTGHYFFYDFPSDDHPYQGAPCQMHHRRVLSP